MKIKIILTLGVILISGFIINAENSFPVENLDSFIKNLKNEFNIPGLAVAVVKEDRIIFEKGYGFREIKSKKIVNSGSLFGIGSTTKAFTSALIAILVHQGKLGWDDKIIKHLPEFKINDPYISREVTVRDLLSHQTGISGFESDKLWMDFTRDRETIIKDVQLIKPQLGFRVKYDYNNVMYLVLGKLIERIMGKSWEDCIQEFIFNPLEMKNSFPEKYKFSPKDNVVTPYDKHKGELIPINFFNIKSIGPAGSIISNLNDLTKWISLFLGEGQYKGKRLWSKSIHQEMLKPQMLNMTSRFRPSKKHSTFFSYGLGWFVGDYRGAKIVFHGGSIPGLYTYIGILPSKKVGVILLSNLTESPVLRPIMFNVFDICLGIPEEERAVIDRSS